MPPSGNRALADRLSGVEQETVLPRPALPRTASQRRRRSRWALASLIALALALAVAIAAYVTWLALAIWRAGGLGGFAEALVTDPELVRQTLFATVPGVTTLTQLALAAIPLALAFRLLDRRLLGPLAATALALALAAAAGIPGRRRPTPVGVAPAVSSRPS
jgi:hypothetical protein